MFKKRMIEHASFSDAANSYGTSARNAIDQKKIERIEFYLKVFVICGVLGTLLMLDTIWGGQLDYEKL
jgi:hypothetical protein